LRRHHRSPARARKPAGQDPVRAFGALRGGNSDALFSGEVQFFLDFLIAGFSPDEFSNDPRLLPSASGHMARINGSKIHLLTRKGLNWTGRFVSVADALKDLGLGSGLLDGEIVVEDASG
jgi:hypothetical protein